MDLGLRRTLLPAGGAADKLPRAWFSVFRSCPMGLRAALLARHKRRFFFWLGAACQIIFCRCGSALTKLKSVANHVCEYKAGELQGAGADTNDGASANVGRPQTEMRIQIPPHIAFRLALYYKQCRTRPMSSERCIRCADTLSAARLVLRPLPRSTALTWQMARNGALWTGLC